MLISWQLQQPKDIITQNDNPAGNLKVKIGEINEVLVLEVAWHLHKVGSSSGTTVDVEEVSNKEEVVVEKRARK